MTAVMEIARKRLARLNGILGTQMMVLSKDVRGGSEHCLADAGTGYQISDWYPEVYFDSFLRDSIRLSEPLFRKGEGDVKIGGTD